MSDTTPRFGRESRAMPGDDLDGGLDPHQAVVEFIC